MMRSVNTRIQLCMACDRTANGRCPHCERSEGSREGMRTGFAIGFVIGTLVCVLIFLMAQ